MALVTDLKGGQPSRSAAPLRHARLLLLEAQALAATSVASGHEVQAAVDAAMNLFEQAAARQVTVLPADPHAARYTARTAPANGRCDAVLRFVAGKGACNAPGAGEVVNRTPSGGRVHSGAAAGLSSGAA